MSRLKTVVGAFLSPARALAEAADGRTFALPLILCTILSVGTTAAVVPRLDFETEAEARLEAEASASGTALTPHERDQKLAMAHKVGAALSYAGAVVTPAITALFLAFAFWIALIVAGGKPGFVPTFCVSAHALLPGALKGVLSVPAALARARIEPKALATLLPSNLAALVPAGGHRVAAALLGAVDLFSLWTLVLLVLGMAHVAHVSRVRAGVATFVLWGAYVAVTRVALGSLGGGGA